MSLNLINGASYKILHETHHSKSYGLSVYLMTFDLWWHWKIKSSHLVLIGLCIIHNVLLDSRAVRPRGLLTIVTLIYPYLVIFALKCPEFTICTIFTLYMYSYIETAPLHNFRAIGPLFMETLHFKELEDTKVLSRMQFGCWSSQWLFLYGACDTLSLY